MLLPSKIDVILIKTAPETAIIQQTQFQNTFGDQTENPPGLEGAKPAQQGQLWRFSLTGENNRKCFFVQIIYNYLDKPKTM